MGLADSKNLTVQICYGDVDFGFLQDFSFCYGSELTSQFTGFV